MNISTTLKGEKSKTEAGAAKKSASDKEKQQEENIQHGRNDVYEQDNQERNLDIPWNLTLNYNYNFNKSNPFFPNKSSTVNLNLGFNLTEKWKFTFSGYYDIFAKQFTAPTINVYRDLHCWEMNFSWRPIGMYSGFNFEIRIKAPQLQDIKLTKQGSTRGVLD
jgi:hypothetical protein